jgi:pimeloyl-ACP methyl ester carboxylesterase
VRPALQSIRVLATTTALLIAFGAACSTPPVGSDPTRPEPIQKQLSASVLSTGRLSAQALQLLERQGLREQFVSDPEIVLQRLLASLRAHDDEDVLYALAEVSYFHAQRTSDLGHYLAAAVYAYALLFPGEGRHDRLAPWDPRLRTTFDLYNRALAEGLLLLRDQHRNVPDLRRLEIPPGRLAIEWNRASLQWNGLPLDGLVPAAHLKVRGLRNRYRKAGIGAPFIASLAKGAALTGFEQQHTPSALKVPVTAFLRVETPRTAIRRGTIQSRLEAYSVDQADSVSIDGMRVPLEAETTSALAHTLETSRIWDLEISAFFSGLPLGTGSMGPGLLLIHPYTAGRIPLVLVHGTASSPARWAELVNEIDNDPRLATRCQIWLFQYNSGNPVGYSAGLFREALSEAVRALDPEERDPALRRMVLLGHSQGGLLAKLAVVSSGDRFWQLVSGKPLGALDLPEATRERLRASLYFEPLPFVKRVIFLATPQRGSYLASWSFARLLSDFITLPKDLAQVALDVRTLGSDAALLRRLDRLPTSLDNMSPGNPFIQMLASLPVDPGVAAHSIIAVKKPGIPQNQSDGVVRYESAHIDGMTSEKVVRSGHSAQGHPDTINEVRRILYEHLGEAPQGG